MNIYDYFNSSDIANYCKDIGHVFNSIEMAYLVEISDRTINEKNMAFQEIIDNYPNMPFHKSVNFAVKTSLHDYLRALIKHRQLIKENFENPNNTQKTYYTITAYDAYCMELDNKLPKNRLLFLTLDELWDFIYPYMIRHNKKNIGILRNIGRKRFGSIILHYNFNKEIIHIFDKYSLSANNELSKIAPNGPGDLSLLFIHIPIPFIEGDIIIVDDKPCVLKSLPHYAKNYSKLESGLLSKDLLFEARPDYAIYFYLNENGDIIDSFPLSHDIRSPFCQGFGLAVDRLHYYNAPLKENEEILLKLSNYIKHPNSKASNLMCNINYRNSLEEWANFSKKYITLKTFPD